MKQVNIGLKKSGTYIDYINHNPREEFKIQARGNNTSKAVYVAVVIQDTYEITDFKIEKMDIGHKEPLAVLNIHLRLKNDIKDKNKFSD
jgi:DNA-binding protein